MSKEIFKLEGTIAINNSEANKSIDETTTKAEKLGSAIEGTGTSADNTSAKLGETSKFSAASTWLGNTLYKLTEKAVELGTNLGKIGFGFNMGIESYQYQFSALLDDEEKAKQLVADLQELAKVSPLGLEGLAANAVSLLNTSTELAEVIPTLEMLGNLALGDPQHMDSVVRAFTQIISKGGLAAQEMHQLGDAMVPIVEIMTKYGGERYADGNWYQQKLKDPTFTIPAEDMIKAFQAATEEGGKWHDFMYIYMESFAGKWDRLGEEGKESLGEFFKPFFEMAKSDVLPGLIESLDQFRTWATDNQDTIAKIADATGKFAMIAFDGALDFFKWMTENGEAVAWAIGVIGTAMGIAAVTAHPYAAAVSAIAGALMLLNSEAGQKRGTFDHMFDGYTDEQLQILNKYVDAMNALKQAEDAALEDTTGNSWEAFDKAEAAMLAAQEEVLAIEGLLATYDTWHHAQAGYEGKNGLALKVQLRTSEDSEGNMQTEIDAMTMDGTVIMHADTSGLQADINATNLTATVGIRGTSGVDNVDGSHAGGLDFVPRDNYIARLHKGEQVLTRSQADAYRNGMSGNDIGRLETAINNLAVMMRQVANNTSGGQMVVLDSGAVVGQLAPMLDAQLGTISGRKGRRN